MSRLTDHELTVLVESAAKGATDSWSGHHGSPTWAQLAAPEKNLVRETALPFIFHGTKALADLGWSKPRVITTAEELDALPVGSVVLSEGYTHHANEMPISFQRWTDGDWHRGARTGNTAPDNFLPVKVLYEP